jgi:predicted DNA-binding ribbon-helix-helix protein
MIRVINSLAVMPESPAKKRKNQAKQVRLEEAFWKHMDYEIERTGTSKQAVLDTIKTPGFTGRRATLRKQNQVGSLTVTAQYK